jgi:hypothetical protein
MQAMDVHKHACSTGRSQQPDWSGRLYVDILQLVSSKLERPCTPGVLNLTSICRAWRAAAGRLPVEAITWHGWRAFSSAEESRRVQLVQRSFKPWLLKAAPQLDSFVLVCNQAHAEAAAVCAALEEAAVAATAAGNPLPLQQLQLPLDATSIRLTPVTTLLAALPNLRSLSVPLRCHYSDYTTQASAAFLKALGGLSHLTSLEVGLFGEMSMRSWGTTGNNWQQLLEAAPKQLQRLCVRAGPEETETTDYCPIYTWAPLAAVPQLKQLQLGRVKQQRDLSPLAALPSLTSLGLQWEGKDWQPLVAIKGVLRELEVADVLPCNQEHLEQLTHLTSLTLRETQRCSSLPEQVASGLQRLEWGVEGLPNRGTATTTSSSSTSRGVDLLAHCSSSNLRDLRLRGRTWFPDRAASRAVQRLTGLTSFGLLAWWPMNVLAPQVSINRWSLAMQSLQQLRRLEVSATLLATPTAWLGALPHLTSLRLAVGWPFSWPVEVDVKKGLASPQVLSNLHSCRAGLKVLEVHLATYIRNGEEMADQPSEVIPVVRQLLQPEVPGVQLLVTWEEVEEPDDEEGWGDGYDSSSTSSDEYAQRLHGCAYTCSYW